MSEHPVDLPKLDWPAGQRRPAYEAARTEAGAALRVWLSAPYGEKRKAFDVYRAAADREDAAALAWMRARVVPAGVPTG